MDLFEWHFQNLNDKNCSFNGKEYVMFGDNFISKHHICYPTFKLFFKHLTEIKEPNIIETGSSAYGTNSSYLFNEYVRKFGGRFWTVDINKETVDTVRSFLCPASSVTEMDSVDFLKKWVNENQLSNVNVYLDSYDLDWYNPQPSGIHGLNEFLAIKPVLQKDSYLLIDDTPVNTEWINDRGDFYNNFSEFKKNNHNLPMPGKGMYIIDICKNFNVKILEQKYQLLYKF
jgi:hypothetical protein